MRPSGSAQFSGRAAMMAKVASMASTSAEQGGAPVRLGSPRDADYSITVFPRACSAAWAHPGFPPCAFPLPRDAPTPPGRRAHRARAMSRRMRVARPGRFPLSGASVRARARRFRPGASRRSSPEKNATNAAFQTDLFLASVVVIVSGDSFATSTSTASPRTRSRRRGASAGTASPRPSSPTARRTLRTRRSAPRRKTLTTCAASARRLRPSSPPRAPPPPRGIAIARPSLPRRRLQASPGESASGTSRCLCRPRTSAWRTCSWRCSKSARCSGSGSRRARRTSCARPWKP